MKPAFVLLFVLVFGLVMGCGPTPDRAGSTGDGNKKDTTQAESEAASNVLATEQTRGPVSVRLEVTPRAPMLSDPIQCTVTVRADEGVKVKQPAVRAALGAFVVRDFRHELPDLEDGKQVLRSVYVLEASRSGTHLIRPVTVHFEVTKADPEAEPGKDYEVVTEPLKLEVGSVLGDKRPDLGAVRGPRGLVELSRPVRRTPWLEIGMVSTALVVLVSGFILWRRRRRAVPAARRHTPEELAYLDLQALIQADLIAAGRYGEFYVELTGIVRRYIERTTQVHAPELTTEEFLREMHDRKLFAADQQQRLQRFLEAADLIKFAARIPGTEEIERSFDTAKAFVGLAGAERAA